MRTQLYSHNKTAYQKVIKAFEASDRTCVVHPTGTGKSYLIAAVSESYKKVLILGPNVFVLDQVHDVLKWRKRGVEYMTYQTLNLTENPHTDYDLICLDEFHRAGAPEWGAAVDRLLEMNAQAKVLGTTATHIRYLDNERNMADELFHGNIASHITIAEAWNQSILPIPRYVSGLFRWDKTSSEAEERILRSRSLSEEEKRKRIFRLNNARLHWELSYGMPAILKKHLDKDAHRVIIFCAHIEALEQMRQEVVGWFREAGFTIASTCIMHSDLPDREQREQMRQFESDKEEGVKLMFSVNMLNEGIHVPNVNAVLMLRTTSSRIIYMQQMGRCLTAANSAKPLVLDMVDNITTTTAIKDIADEFELLEKESSEHEGRKPRRFEVLDYTLSVRELIDKLVVRQTKRTLTLKEHLDIVKEHCRIHGTLPVTGRSAAVASWNWLRKNYSDYQEVVAIREEYSKLTAVDGFRKIYISWVNSHHRLPVTTSDDSDERRIAYQWSYFRKYLIDDPEIKLLRDQYSAWQIKLTERIERVRKFCEDNGRTPIVSDGKIYKDWSALNYGEYKNDPRIIEIRLTYQDKSRRRDEASIRKRLKHCFDFLKVQRRLPRSSGLWITEEEISIYHQLYDLRRKGAKHHVEQKLLALVDRIKEAYNNITV